MKTNTTTKTYPAGRYWIGDLCYVKTIDWSHFCAAIIQGDACLDGDFEIDGIETWHHRTALGDGVYVSNLGYSFPVDSGLIGLVKAEYAEGVDPLLGNVIDIDHDFVPVYDDGIFFIGPLEIDTKEEPDEDEEAFDDDESYDDESDDDFDE
jgi:hypothetical protein